jgi:hypothetical protein
MQDLVGGIFAALVAVLAVGALTGRIRARSCCAVADPARDKRMWIGPDDSLTDSAGVSTPSGVATGPAGGLWSADEDNAIGRLDD